MAMVTLVQGPQTYSRGGVSFSRGRPVPVDDENLLEALRHNKDFRIEGWPKPEKTDLKTVRSKFKATSVKKEDVETEESDDDSDDEDDEESEVAVDRAELKKLSKNELIQLAKKHSVSVDKDSSKAAIIDTIVDAIGEDE